MNLLWLLLHQVHHSPRRIEAITSFFKHPLEIMVNSIIISGIVYGLFGLSIESRAIVILLIGIAEFSYHMNIRTPRWWGYILQRPEMHRIHHERGVHTNNFADLPI
ncbi:MAG: sterol desaturase/sphingolipid hydroxylase (fatty acid hydroxylase superfamily) [Bradymonadia bacterium]|jgi:sterol desaturase/sphingolipid hydroxylase (fatty acid hydroxylase superfamily)